MSITFAHCLWNFQPSKKIRIRFDFLRFRIRCMHFDRKGWEIRKNGKMHAKISVQDSVCNGLKSENQCRPLSVQFINHPECLDEDNTKLKLSPRFFITSLEKDSRSLLQKVHPWWTTCLSKALSRRQLWCPMTEKQCLRKGPQPSIRFSFQSKVFNLLIS